MIKTVLLVYSLKDFRKPNDKIQLLYYNLYPAYLIIVKIWVKKLAIY